MIAGSILAAFLLAHAAIHTAYLAPRPPGKAGGPEWPFERHSQILGSLGATPAVDRPLALVLVATTIGGFAMAALAALGVAPAAVWPAAVVIGGASSLALLVLFFHPWLLLGVVIDVALLWLVLLARWAPEA